MLHRFIDPVKTGKLIAKEMKSHGLGSSALARLLDVRPQTVSKYKSGTTLPSTQQFYKLSQIFNKPMDELIVPRKEFQKNM